MTCPGVDTFGHSAEMSIKGDISPPFSMSQSSCSSTDSYATCDYPAIECPPTSPDTGLEPSSTGHPPICFPQDCAGCEASKSVAPLPHDIIIRSSPDSPSRVAFHTVKELLDLDTGNLPDLSLLIPTSGKKKPVLKAPSSSSAKRHYVETMEQIGLRYYTRQRREILRVRIYLTQGIPADITIRYYRSLVSIASDFEQPVAVEKTVNVFHGRTETGKSRRAWEEAGVDAYPKDPRTKWWDGYKGQKHVVIDEFRGAIDISHMLRWLDRYPVRVERKGSSICLRATTFWITSNLHPDCWYLDLDEATKLAFKRRLTNIIEFE